MKRMLDGSVLLTAREVRIVRSALNCAIAWREEEARAITENIYSPGGVVIGHKFFSEMEEEGRAYEKASRQYARLMRAMQ